MKKPKCEGKTFKETDEELDEDQKLLNEIGAIPKSNRTPLQKKILKTDRCVTAFALTLGAGLVTMILSLLGVVGASIYVQAKNDDLQNKNREGLEKYKAEQIEELNRQFDGGKGFSSEEFDERYNALQKEYVKDYFSNVASEEMRLEYQNLQSTDNALVVSTLTAGGIGALCTIVGTAAGMKSISRTELLLEAERVARITSGNAKDL